MMSRRSAECGSHRLPAVLATLLMLSGPGCASVSLLNLKTDKVAMADAAHPAIEILAIWQAAEGPGPKGIPVRGFAGQIFFFSQDRETPVAVDGEARIYVFDDHGTSQQQVQPLHQYDFDRASWTAHLQNSKIGPTYGVFIPYPRNDYHQAVCSLRIRFSAPKTRPLYSPSSTIVLPGPPLKPEAEVAQVSPLDSLAKKLQAQPQRTWQKPNLGTEPTPLNLAAQQTPNQLAPGQLAPSQSPADTLPPDQLSRTRFAPAQVALAQATAAQMAAANQPTQQFADPSQTQMNQTQMVPTPIGGPTGSYTNGRYTSIQTGQAARANSILQTSATTADPIPMAPAEFGGSQETPLGYANSGQPGVVPPSGRIRLQAAAPLVTHAYWSSESAGSGNAENVPSGEVQPPQSFSHQNHPLADQEQ